jgi:hypothetical protein
MARLYDRNTMRLGSAIARAGAIRTIVPAAARLA